MARLRGNQKREATRLAKEQRIANRGTTAKSTKKSYVMPTTQDKMIKALYREFLSTQKYIQRVGYTANAIKQSNKALRQLGVNVGAPLTKDNLLRLSNTSILSNAMSDSVVKYLKNQVRRANGEHVPEQQKSQYEKWKETRERANRKKGFKVDDAAYAEAYDIFANDLYHELLELHLIESDQVEQLAVEYPDLEMSDIENAMREMLKTYKSKANEYEEILSPNSASEFLHGYLDNLLLKRNGEEEE